MPVTDSLALRVLLTLLVAFGPLSTDLYLPALPILVTFFGTDVATVQLTLSVFMAGFALSQLIHGPLSDRFGRRPVVLGGLLLFIVATLACALAQNIEQLIVARFFQALGGCVGPVVGRAVVRDVYGRDRAAAVMSYMAMAMALAPALGPFVGGFVTGQFGWRANFLVLLAIAVAALVAAWLLLEETNRYRDDDALSPSRLIANYGRLLRDRAYLGYTSIASMVFAGLFAFISSSSFLLVSRLGLSPTEFGLCFGAVVLGFMGGSFSAGRLNGRVHLVTMLRMGTTIAAASGVAGLALALGGVFTVVSVAAPMMAFLFAAGLIMPNAMAAAVANYPTMAGVASSLLGVVQMTVAAVVGVVVGHVDDGTARPLMITLAAAGVCAAIIAVRMRAETAIRGGGLRETRDPSDHGEM